MVTRESLDRTCERAILGVVLAILCIGPAWFGAVGTGGFLVVQALTLVVLLLWAARFWLNPPLRLLWPPVCWAVLAFAAYAVGRYLWADIEYVARLELLRVLVYAALFLAIVNNLHRQESVQIVTIVLIFLGMAIAGYALFQFATHSSRVWYLQSPYKGRATGTYISPNNLGGFLETLLPLALAHSLLSRFKPVMKIFLGYAALVILAGIGVTISRGSWISTALAILLFCGILSTQPGFRLPSLLLVLMLAASALYLVPKSYALHARLKQLYQGGKLDEDARFQLWRPAVEIWRENIWFGAGPDHFDHRFRMYRPVTIQLQPERVHNDFLNTVTDWGIVGGALVATALGLVLWDGFKTWRTLRGTPRDLGEKRTSNKRAFVLGASMGLAALFFHSAVDFNMHIPANAILALTLMALLVSHSRFATERYWTKSSRGLAIVATLLMLGLAVYLGAEGFRNAKEYFWLEKANRKPAFSPARVALLQKAFSVEPRNADTAYDIGEALRRESLEGGEAYQGESLTNYRDLASRAMEWFQRAMKLDRWNGYNYLGYGSCLDWLERKQEAAPWFDRAEELDPNGYFTVSGIALHYIELGDNAAAREWFQRSLRLERDNPIAKNYLEILNRNMLEAATDDLRSRLKAALREHK